MEFANEVVTLIGNIFGCVCILAFIVGILIGIHFLIQIKKQDKEDYDRKKAMEELEYKESELRYKKLLEDKR